MKLKNLVLLFILLLGNFSYADELSFPSPKTPDVDLEVLAELGASDQEEAEFQITSSTAPSLYVRYFCDATLFRLLSERKVLSLSIYEKCSRNLSPGLDIQSIIFPFHYFF